MKKILAASLALLMMATTVSLAACSKDDPAPADPDDDEFEYNYSSDTDSDAAAPSDSDNAESETQNESPNGEWIEKNDKIVVAVDRVVLRDGPGRDYDAVKTLNWNTVLDRVGTNGNWHKVNYDGGEYYINSDYTSREVKDFSFTDYPAAEQISLNVRLDCQVNLRETPFYTEYDPYDNVIFAGFKDTETDGEGESLKLIAKSESGNWYKVSFTGTWGSKTYENKICYLAASSAKYIAELNTTAGSTDNAPTRG